MNYVIRDWAGNLINPLKLAINYKVAIKPPPTSFKSFEEAEDFLCEVLNDNYDDDRQEYYIEEE